MSKHNKFKLWCDVGMVTSCLGTVVGAIGFTMAAANVQGFWWAIGFAWLNTVLSAVSLFMATRYNK